MVVVVAKNTEDVEAHNDILFRFQGDVVAAQYPHLQKPQTVPAFAAGITWWTLELNGLRPPKGYQ